MKHIILAFMSLVLVKSVWAETKVNYAQKIKITVGINAVKNDSNMRKSELNGRLTIGVDAGIKNFYTLTSQSMVPNQHIVLMESDFDTQLVAGHDVDVRISESSSFGSKSNSSDFSTAISSGLLLDQIITVPVDLAVGKNYQKQFKNEKGDDIIVRFTAINQIETTYESFEKSKASLILEIEEKQTLIARLKKELDSASEGIGKLTSTISTQEQKVFILKARVGFIEKFLVR